MTKVCICQICTCGRHRCPHHPQVTVKRGSTPCLLTEYAQTYKSHPIEATHSFKPSNEPMQYSGPLEDKTTNRVDYIPHPVEKPFVHQPDQYQTPEGNFDHLTNYTKDYPKKAVDRAKPVRRDNEKRPIGKFEGNPTYKADYRRWSAQKPKAVVHDSGYRPSSAPFKGNSNYQTDYIKHLIATRQSLKPQEEAKLSNQPFDGTTGYKQEYIKHALPKREMREKQMWEANKVPLDGMTNYMKDYFPKQADKTQSFKPDGGAYNSDAPFEDATTNRVDYTKWPTEKPFVHEHEVYQKPEGNFDHATTNQIEYTKKPLQKTSAKKPADRKVNLGKFEGHTNYNQDFRKWALPDRNRPKGNTEYSAPQAPFEGLPTYVSDYRKHPYALRQSYRPVENAKQSDQPFDGTTGYKSEYIKHPLEKRMMKDAPKWSPNPVPLNGLTNYQKDFIAKQADKVQSCRPEDGGYNSNAPFVDETTNRVDYLKWATNKPPVREAEVYVQPEGDFDFYTTHRKEYTKKPLEPAKPKRPSSSKRAPGKFEGLTNYSEDYKKWSSGGRPMPKPRAEYMAPEAPFEGQTNYHHDYIKHNTKPPHSLKPADKAVGSEQPFEGNTMYNTDYTKKHLPPCPVPALETGRTGHVFKFQDPSGHKWYEQQRSAVPTPPKIENPLLNQQMTALAVA